jgi:hypothetical protein
MISLLSSEISESNNKQKYETTQYTPPPPIEKIKNNNCLDIIKTINLCMTGSQMLTEDHGIESIKIKKIYQHPIFYSSNDLNECIHYQKFQKNNINVDITEKMNTQLHYTVICKKDNQKIHVIL